MRVSAARTAPRLALAAGVLLTLAVGLAHGLACSHEPQSPEDRIRAVLAALEAGAEAKNAGAMKQHVSESYADAQGNDKRAIAQLVAFHLLRNQSVYLLTRVVGVAIESPGQGSVDVLVAMAGTPIAGAEALAGLRADLYRFDLQLAAEPDGEWRVRSAEWRPAAIDDFR